MGNRFSRKRETPASSTEAAAAAAAEQKPAEDPVSTQPAEPSEVPQQVAVGEQVAAVLEIPAEAVVSEVKADEAAVTECKPATEEPPAPVEPEPLVSVSEPSPPEPEPVAEPEPVVEAQPATEPTPEPVPPQPEPTPEPVADVEEVSVPVPAPAEALQEEPECLAQESLPEPVLSSAPLVDLGVPDETPLPVNTPPAADDLPAPLDTEPADVPGDEACPDSVEAADVSTEVPENVVEVQMEANDAGNLEQLIDINEENVSGLLQHLELTGNDHVTDLICSDVKMPDDHPIIDMSPSTELM